MIRRIIYFLVVTLLLGGLAGGIGWYAFDFKPKFLAEVILGSPRPTETIAAEAARSETWQPYIAGIGTLAAVEGIDITSQVGGVVEKLEFDSGQDVKKGQLLLTLNSDTEVAEMRGLTAEITNAEDEFQRRSMLLTKGVASRTEVNVLRMRRDSLQADIDRLRAVIEQKSIFAPWDGRLGIRQISVGSYVAPGQKIVWLQKIDSVYADFPVTEADYGRIKQGLPVTAQFNSWPNETFKGEIVTTGGYMSDATRMITVRAKLANPDGKLLPGMYANVLVDAGSPEAVVTVPQTAVTFSLYGDNVLVVVPASKLDPKAKAGELVIDRRFIKAGQVRDGRVEIVSGLAPGDQVVTAGQNKVDQGSKVVINNSIALKATDSATIQ